ncbi:YceI family protein [Paenirhodobacter populi]|uniref:YceI family protein n=1 Tax=Paenirhodobacter populi TaxID=2306993 RepID=UPI0019D462EC|nr:YceI family protein [Sinirhodobacter populi]
MIRAIPTILAFMAVPLAAYAEPQAYRIDTSHSQAVFSFNHHGFSQVSGILTGISGTILFDRDAPEASSVTAAIPLASLTTGHEDQDRDILSPDFLGAEKAPEVTFRSSSIEVVGIDRALIGGELSLNGITKQVVLDTVLRKDGVSMKGTPTLGLEATTTLLRSDFGAGRSAPDNSDMIEVRLSIEAAQAGQQ